MDVAPDAETADNALTAPSEKKQWLADFLLNGTEADGTDNPNDSIAVVLTETDIQGNDEAWGTGAEDLTDPLSAPLLDTGNNGNGKGIGKKK
jgi:hypothetical protein